MTHPSHNREEDPRKVFIDNALNQIKDNVALSSKMLFTHNRESWEEDFEKKFPFLLKWERFPEEVESIKSFITSLLSQTREDTLKEVGEMVKEMRTETFKRMGYTGEKLIRDHLLTTLSENIKKL